MYETVTAQVIYRDFDGHETGELGKAEEYIKIGDKFYRVSSIVAAVIGFRQNQLKVL